jgi:multiple sugar transport system permease protein/sn-glycerol 3-phosphate transport system permease protein
LIFTTFSVGSTLVLALAAALLLHQPLRFRTVVRATLFAPAILPGSAVALVWAFLYAPNFGFVSQAAVAAGLPKVRYLNDPFWAMPAIILVVVWRRVGYDAVIFLAGLQGISRELYEAARVDGANAWQRFRHVTVPGLSPVAFFLVVTSILASFQSFDVIRVMTSGGPVIATTTLIYQVFQEAFVAFNAGRAAVYAAILFALMLSVTILQLRLLERRVTYE